MWHGLLIFLGGGLGSLARWLTGLLVLRLWGGGIPAGTLAVNLIGCFAMGFLARVLPMPEAGGQAARFLLMTGFLGGYTTFSAFALDANGLWLRGEIGASLIYLALSVCGSLAALGFGLWLGMAATR